MAVLVGDGRFEFAGRCASIFARRLPPYARPLFLRIRDGIEVTGTFKHKKSDLVRDGFDPKATQDAIYFDDPAQHRLMCGLIPRRSAWRICGRQASTLEG